jgi:hypothetical protein
MQGCFRRFPAAYMLMLLPPFEHLLYNKRLVNQIYSAAWCVSLRCGQLLLFFF